MRTCRENNIAGGRIKDLALLPTKDMNKTLDILFYHNILALGAVQGDTGWPLHGGERCLRMMYIFSYKDDHGDVDVGHCKSG